MYDLHIIKLKISEEALENMNENIYKHHEQLR